MTVFVFLNSMICYYTFHFASSPVVTIIKKLLCSGNSQQKITTAGSSRMIHLNLFWSDEYMILKFLQKFFYKDEPLNSFLELINEDHPRCLDLEKFSLKELDNGLNLLAIHDGKLIGVCLNDLLERDKEEEEFDCNDEKFGKIVCFLDHVAKQSNPFLKYPGIDKAVTVKILSVDGSYRGKGIAKDLMARTRELAREKGCGFISVDCTSHFTACAARKLGFEHHYTLKYEDYKIDGKVVFKPAAPHRALTVYTQKIV